VPSGRNDGRLTGKTVLAVFAHPDDESLACGGTLARLSDEGARVVLVCASHGELGALTGGAVDGAIGAIRAQELEQAADTLGIGHVLIFNHPDGELQWAEVAAFHAELMLTVKRFAPDAVITFGRDGLYWHRDHIGVYERTTTAVILAGQVAPPLYYVTMPRDVMPTIVGFASEKGWTAPGGGFWSLAPDAFGDAADEPTIVLDVTPWAERKLNAIRCHGSQTGPRDPFGLIDAEQARRWLGHEHFNRAPTPTSKPPLLELLNLNS
jgi:LmbE family N-acetylglucosaminyl deacetylase